jgi:transcriptional regulator with XRE-family HTH domain
MTTPDQVLSEFMDAWNAGRRPSVDDYLEKVAPAERDELAEQIGTWLSVAPAPAYDADATAAIRADPLFERVMAITTAEGGALSVELPVLRARAGLGIAQVARKLVAALGLQRGDEERTADYLERVESGELDPARLSRRLLDALAGVLDVTGERLLAAADLPRPAAAGGALFRAEAGSGDWLAEETEAIAAAAFTPAPATMGELDRLFLGGREA